MPFPIKALQSIAAKDFFALVSDDALKISYSQMGEDIVIHYLLSTHIQNLSTGFYVDVGAHHPRTYSNTKFLHILGWRGINIDANKESIDLFNAERPNDINICSGVAANDGELTFFKFAGGAPSTLSPEQAAIWQNKYGWRMVGTETVAVRKINSILEDNLPSGQDITYLNVDIEGLDEEVIQGFDFNKYRPKIVSIEIHKVNILSIEKNATIDLIIRNGYKLVSVNLMTFIFIDESYWKK